MRIGQLAEITGHTAETIRYYERSGLLPAPRRLDNNYRVYGALHITRLDFIRRCRGLGIGLEEIKELLTGMASDDAATAETAHRLIHKHLLAVEERIAELRLLEQSLRTLESACPGHHAAGERCELLERLAAPGEKHPSR